MRQALTCPNSGMKIWPHLIAVWLSCFSEAVSVNDEEGKGMILVC